MLLTIVITADYNDDRIISFEWVSEGEIVNQECYQEVLTSLREKCEGKEEILGKPRIDSLPEQRLVSKTVFGEENDSYTGKSVLLNGVNSIWHFLVSYNSTKSVLKETYFDWIGDWKSEEKNVRMPVQEFQHCIEQCKSHMQRWDNNRDVEYIERDKSWFIIFSYETSFFK